MPSSLGLGLGLPHGGNQVGAGGTAPPDSAPAILMETTGYILLEDDSLLLLE